MADSAYSDCIDFGQQSATIFGGKQVMVNCDTGVSVVDKHKRGVTFADNILAPNVDRNGGKNFGDEGLNRDRICADLQLRLLCWRNILLALRSVHDKWRSVGRLCGCGANANRFVRRTDAQFRRLIDKYERLRDGRDLGGITGETVTAVKHTLLPKTATDRRVVAKRRRKSGNKRRADATKTHVCWFEGCNAGFQKRSNLLAHIAKHTGEKAFVCGWTGCGKEFPYKRSLDRHVEAIHLKTARYRCQWPACGQSFITRSQLDCHTTATHTGEKWYKCDEDGCLFSTNYVKHMKDHKARHDPNYIAERQNSVRQLSLESGATLDEDLVNKKTGRPLIRRRRPKNNRCSWPNCDFAYDLPNELKRHMRRHTGETPFACEWPGCDKRFGYKHALKIHVEMVHLMLKKYRCNWPACEAAFVSQIQLDVHNRDVHIGVKKFKCDWPGCEWIGTNHAREMRFHKLRRHEGIKIVRKSEVLRKERLKRERLSEKRHDRQACGYPQCGTRSAYKSMLEMHNRAHRWPTDGSASGDTFCANGIAYADEEV